MSQYRIDSQQYLDHNKTTFEVVMIGDQDGNIVNTFGAASNVIISAGQLAGYEGIHKYGAVYGTAVGTMSTVWTAADTTATALYNWSHASGVVSVVSTSGSDTGDIKICGLDSSYNYAEDTITLTGTSAATGTTSFTRVNRMFMLDNTNVGKIQASISGTVVSEIAIGYGQTLQCFYTIPAGKTGYLLNLSVSASKNQVADIFLFQRPFGGAFRVTTTMSLNQSNQQLDYPIPIKFTEKTDIDLRTRGSSNATVSAEFSLVLVDNA